MTPRTAPTRAWPRGHVLAGVAAALVLGTTLGACFNPPAADVMFSCDPAAAGTCPNGYTCEADGCCHRDGSDVEADFGGCGLGKGASAGPTTTPTTATTGAPDTTDAPTTGTAADTTTTTATTGSSGSTGSTGSSGEPDTSTTGTTGTSGGSDSGSSSGSSSAGTTG